MKYSLPLIFSLIAVAVTPTWAQQDQNRGLASRIELYGGYTYIRFNINASASVLQPPSETFNGNGGGGQLVYNISNWLGVMGDVSGYWATNATKRRCRICLDHGHVCGAGTLRRLLRCWRAGFLQAQALRLAGGKTISPWL